MFAGCGGRDIRDLGVPGSSSQTTIVPFIVVEVEVGVPVPVGGYGFLPDKAFPFRLSRAIEATAGKEFDEVHLIG